MTPNVLIDRSNIDRRRVACETMGLAYDVPTEPSTKKKRWLTVVGDSQAVIGPITQGEAFAIADMLTEGKLSALLAAIDANYDKGGPMSAGLDAEEKWRAEIERAREAFR